MDQKGGRAVTRDKRDNFLLFINSKILRERIGRGRVYTHMYIGAVFSCTGCSPGSVYEGNSRTRNSKELDSGGVICPLATQPRDTTQLFVLFRFSFFIRR